MRFKNLILSTLAVAAIFFIGCSMSSGSSIHSDNSKEAKVKRVSRLEVSTRLKRHQAFA